MTANVTALHSGRTRALVQRKNRKAHFASIAAGEGQWLGLCGWWIEADGTDVTLKPTIEQIKARADQTCIPCAAIFGLCQYEAARAVEAALTLHIAGPHALRAVR